MNLPPATTYDAQLAELPYPPHIIALAREFMTIDGATPEYVRDLGDLPALGEIADAMEALGAS